MTNANTRSLYHIAIAVNNIEEAEKLYESALGLKVTHREVIEDQGVRASMLEPEGGGTAIELLEPLHENSPISKFLEKRGEGIHHIAFLVDDLVSALEELKKEGVRLIDESPRVGAHYTRVAFIHPKALNGVLIELAEKEKKDG
ncbi:MAG: methylmalonyl-CoA epimerase [Candidatus Dadabacteria bacterium]|nr:methylmalonyl-CoA epimerase [Candidatus Dadabacteria bacterium]